LVEWYHAERAWTSQIETGDKGALDEAAARMVISLGRFSIEQHEGSVLVFRARLASRSSLMAVGGARKTAACFFAPAERQAGQPYWPVQQQQAHQLERLKQLLVHAGQHVPYYR